MDHTEKEKEGKIRNIGFSFHGNTEMFIQILDAYDWDFCQIQYNYMDEYTQAGRTGLQEAANVGSVIIIPFYAVENWWICYRKKQKSELQKIQRNVLGRTGIPLAVGTTGGDLCAFGDEFRRDDP